jgi:hypothetical protein
MMFALTPSAPAQSTNAGETLSQPTNSQDILTQSIANLQGNPADTALREKIIKMVLTMNPKPAVPDEVATHVRHQWEGPRLSMSH